MTPTDQYLQEVEARVTASRGDVFSIGFLTHAFEDIPRLLEMVKVMREALELIAGTDTCVSEPNAIWLTNWRNDRKRFAQNTLTRVEQIARGEK